MTYNQKFIISKLLQGATISASGPGQIRLRDAADNPLMKITDPTWDWLKSNVLRKKKKLFLVDLRKVRSFHGNSFVKKLYKGKVAVGDKQNTPPHKKEHAGTGARPNAFLTITFNTF